VEFRKHLLEVFAGPSTWRPVALKPSARKAAAALGRFAFAVGAPEKRLCASIDIRADKLLHQPIISLLASGGMKDLTYSAICR